MVTEWARVSLSGLHHKPSKIANHMAQFDAKCFGDPPQRINRDGPIGALDLAYVNAMQAGLPCQPCLRQPASLTIPADVPADQSIRLQSLALLMNGRGHELRVRLWPTSDSRLQNSSGNMSRSLILSLRIKSSSLLRVR